MDFNYPVAKVCPLFFQGHSGQFEPVPDRFIVICEGTNTRFAEVSKRYNILQHEDCVNFFRTYADPLIKEFGEPEVKRYLSPDGGLLVYDLIFKNSIIPLDIKGGKKTRLRMRVINSHTQEFSFYVEMSMVRDGVPLTSVSKESQFTTKHFYLSNKTASLLPDLSAFKSGLEGDCQTMEEWQSISINNAEYLSLIKSLEMSGKHIRKSFLPAINRALVESGRQGTAHYDLERKKSVLPVAVTLWVLFRALNDHYSSTGIGLVHRTRAIKLVSNFFLKRMKKKPAFDKSVEKCARLVRNCETLPMEEGDIEILNAESDNGTKPFLNPEQECSIKVLKGLLSPPAKDLLAAIQEGPEAYSGILYNTKKGDVSVSTMLCWLIEVAGVTKEKGQSIIGEIKKFNHGMQQANLY